MCVIAHCETKTPDLAQLLKMQTSNRAGGGVAWFEGDHVRWAKGINAHRIANIIAAVKLPVVIHFRLATVGGESKKLCHPFPLTEKAETQVRGTAEGVLFHNGHENNWEKYLKISGAKMGNGPVSDTRALAAITGRNRNPSWLSEASGKFVLMYSKTVNRIGQFHELDGVQYSNLYWNYNPVTTHAGAGSSAARGTTYQDGRWVDDYDWRNDERDYRGPIGSPHLNGITYGTDGWTFGKVTHSKSCVCQPCLSRDAEVRRNSTYKKKPFHEQTGMSTTVHGPGCYCKPCIDKRNTERLKTACTRADAATECAVTVETGKAEIQIMVCGKWETELTKPENHGGECNCVPCVEYRNQQFFIAEDAELHRQVEEREKELALAEAEGEGMTNPKAVGEVVKSVVGTICEQAVAGSVVKDDPNAIVLVLDGVSWTRSALEAVARQSGVSYETLVEDVGTNLVPAGNQQ